jgi:hypothetical protein
MLPHSAPWGPSPSSTAAHPARHRPLSPDTCHLQELQSPTPPSKNAIGRPARKSTWNREASRHLHNHLAQRQPEGRLGPSSVSQKATPSLRSPTQDAVGAPPVAATDTLAPTMTTAWPAATSACRSSSGVAPTPAHLPRHPNAARDHPVQAGACCIMELPAEPLRRPNQTMAGSWVGLHDRLVYPALSREAASMAATGPLRS